MQYQKQEDGSFAPLPKRNIDFGGGLERLAMAVNNTPDIIKVCHEPILAHIEQATKKTYGEDPKDTEAFRIVADHMKAAVFLIGDGVAPSNTDQGYFVRRLIRRAVRMADTLGMHENSFADVVEPITAMYEGQYPNLRTQADSIRTHIADEEAKFRKTLDRGLKKIEHLIERGNAAVTAEALFDLYQTDGFPLELSLEIITDRLGTPILEDTLKKYDTLLAEHKKKSRAGSEQKFKGGLADSGEVTTMLHTCTHLLLAGLRKQLGDHVHQAGSNITSERARFDFTHPEKVSREVLDQVEAYVNEAIQKGCTVTTTIMEKQAAQDAGVEGSFWERYPDQVTVYEIEAPDGSIYSQELCGGPHVESTGNIKGTFRIKKEESSSAGVRRVKAILEP